MKTNFISNLKRIAFLVLAIFGAFSCYSQSPQNPSIGGSKTPSTDPIGQFLDVGGSEGTPRDSGGGLIVLSKNTQCIFAFPSEIGGGGKGTGTNDTGSGQFDDHDLDPYDIGGKSSSGGLGLIEIGGRGSRGNGTSTGGELAWLIETGGRGSVGTGTNSGTGQFDDDYDPYDIGGKSTTGGLGNFACSSDTGGGKGTTGGDTGQRTDPTYTDPLDIGGRGTNTGTGLLSSLDLEHIPGYGCLVDTGGRDSETGLGTSNADIGGGKSSDTGLGLRTVADTGGRNGHGTSTTGDYSDDDDDNYNYDTGGRGSRGTTGEFAQTYVWLDSPN